MSDQGVGGQQRKKLLQWRSDGMPLRGSKLAQISKKGIEDDPAKLIVLSHVTRSYASPHWSYIVE
jgi:hypothetical protein